MSAFSHFLLELAVRGHLHSPTSYNACQRASIGDEARPTPTPMNPPPTAAYISLYGRLAFSRRLHTYIQLVWFVPRSSFSYFLTSSPTINASTSLSISLLFAAMASSSRSCRVRCFGGTSSVPFLDKSYQPGVLFLSGQRLEHPTNVGGL
jgi:hypothetical protein